MPVAMDDRLMQERRRRRRDVFTKEIKRNDCSLSDATACPKLLEKVKFEVPHKGNENSKAGTTVLKRNDHFSFNIQEDSLLQYEGGEVSANTAKIQNWLIEILNPGELQKCVEVEKCSDDIHLVIDKTMMCYLVM